MALRLDFFIIGKKKKQKIYLQGTPEMQDAERHVVFILIQTPSSRCVFFKPLWRTLFVYIQVVIMIWFVKSTTRAGGVRNIHHTQFSAPLFDFFLC